MAGKADKKKADYSDRVIANNRRARFDYELGKTFEAGLVLMGSEVRALREGSADLSDSWVDVSGGEAWVKGLRIPTLKHAAFAHEEKRARKLLLHLRQLQELAQAKDREQMTLVPTKLYFKEGRAKLELAVARGKKQYDKRQTLREKDAAKEAHDAIRRGKGR
jgi:SsrA-binding protein